ncbi:MAG: Hsp70 family protein [Acidobacteriia bacterium]|nr:Hsp70 family protein [Terriglobia bacterium]
MRLGIDFGTTRTVVAAVDRGNYPVISFQTEAGDMQAWYPSLIGVRGGQTVFGLEAQAHQGEPGWCFLRSLKRSLIELSPDATVTLGGRPTAIFDLLVQYLARLRRDLYECSNLEVKSKEPLEAQIAIPANANSNQRFLTLEGFRRAGFRVLGMINEPSAAGIEYAHSHIKNEWTARKEYLVVYDLGGGTFDASVIGLANHYHEVVTDEGIACLGGDDVDVLLLDLALSRASCRQELSETARYYLLEECRRQKEGLHPNTRKIAIDLARAIEGSGTVIVTTEELYARCAPLVEQTITAMEAAMGRARQRSGVAWGGVETIYLVGGSSDLPIVGRMLRERYGRRVRRSPYPYSATAIGLAIAADAEAGHQLKERFTRHFGVWREAESGRRVVFDPIFPKDTPLPERSKPSLAHTRIYHPAHNVAHFRYLECSRLTEDGQPAGDITPWDEIVFPVDPALRAASKPDIVEVRRADEFASQLIEERYLCNPHGIIEVTITDQTTFYQQKYRLRQPTVMKQQKSVAKKR